MASRRKSTKQKNSLVANINRRKRAGKSRAKSRSTISRKAYRDMQAGWPRNKARKKGNARSSYALRQVRTSGTKVHFASLHVRTVYAAPPTQRCPL